MLVVSHTLYLPDEMLIEFEAAIHNLQRGLSGLNNEPSAACYGGPSRASLFEKASVNLYLKSPVLNLPSRENYGLQLHYARTKRVL